MKKHKIEIIIVIIFSLLIWVYFKLKSIPLERHETIFVVGVILLIVFTISFIIKKIRRKKNEKS